MPAYTHAVSFHYAAGRSRYAPNDVRAMRRLPMRRVLLPEFLLQCRPALVTLLHRTHPYSHTSVVNGHVHMIFILGDIFNEFSVRVICVGAVRRDGDTLAAGVEQCVTLRLDGTSKRWPAM